MTGGDTPAQGLRAPARTEFLAPGLIAWRRVLMALVVVALAQTLLGRNKALTEFFFYRQDLAVAGGLLVLLTGLYLVRPLTTPLPAPPVNWRAAGLIAIATTAFAWIGSRLVYDGYALSLDEYMAVFDARIFQAGHWAARVPAEWRAYTQALQPQFVLTSPDHSFWISGYEPMNAALRALAGLAGAESLLNPALAGVAVLATYGAARRLWPERPQAAAVAA
ncbi:MAG: hypothetical protein JWR47_3520, partial [Phenylobacterium sp.]|nr:hypothetical protein [Phenylobacterium sp.]